VLRLTPDMSSLLNKIFFNPWFETLCNNARLSTISRSRNFWCFGNLKNRAKKDFFLTKKCLTSIGECVCRAALEIVGQTAECIVVAKCKFVGTNCVRQANWQN
jgi:hypothetical protein